MKRILFVDDDPNILNGIQRMFYKMREEWEMVFAQSGKEALEILASEPFDAIVSDMRMPEMNGAQLLFHVKRLHPGMVRFILSGHSDPELIMQCVGCTHQFLVKPCEPEHMIATIRNSFYLRNLVADESLRKTIAQIPSLPTLPQTYQQLVAALGEEDCSLSKIADIVSIDVGMTSKILQLVNSAFFGLPRHIENPSRAVSMLGVETIKSLVLGVGLFEQFKSSGVELNLLEGIYSHSIAVGTLAQKHARELRMEKRIVDEALLAGIMHDIGKPILMLYFPERLAQARKLAKDKNLYMCEAEKQVFGVNHSEIGAALLSLWGESDGIVEAVAHHHSPNKTYRKVVCALTAVHTANVAQQRTANDDINTDTIESLDTEYFAQLSLGDEIGKLTGLAPDRIAAAGEQA